MICVTKACGRRNMPIDESELACIVGRRLNEEKLVEPKTNK